jgi:cysteinyl-tRNA synthetase
MLGTTDMVTIRLTNSKTRKKEDFVPIDPSNVRMYVCGPTVYDRAHLGNARPVVVFDTLYRLLRHVYGPDHVTYVRNFTDVDDKINAEALRRQKAGSPGTLEELIHQRTEETIAWYHADMGALGALRPDHEPRATEFIAQMIAMIEGLIASGHAYAVEGHVLFRVRSYEGYGKLSGRSVDDMIAGARVEVAPFKEDPMDFVLWKPSSGEEPGWASPWGKGRPGWHIECSAMAHELLGESFDIHGGGLDLQFPHHENEIAQSACAHPHGDFAHYWLHNEMLQVEGKKMSKSLGNFFTVRDLLEKGVRGDAIRYVLLNSHYRTVVDWSEMRHREATVAIEEMIDILLLAGPEALYLKAGQPLPHVVETLADDINTNLALSLLRMRNLKEKYGEDMPIDLIRDIYATQLLLGFDFRLEAVKKLFSTFSNDELFLINEAIQIELRLKKIAEQMDRAREDKDYITSDRLRKSLEAIGAKVTIEKSGTKIQRGLNFDPAKLEALQ